MFPSRLLRLHVSMVVLVSFNCIGTMVRKLGAKPFVKGDYKGGISSAKGQLSPSTNVLVVNDDLARLCSLELREARHVIPVNLRRCREISVSKLLPDATQVFAYQAYLRLV